MKQHISLFAAMAFLFAGCSLTRGTQNKLSQKEVSQGWQLLFNGRNTNGWHTYGQSKADPSWEVKNGVLFLNENKAKELPSNEIGDLVTNEEYGNFDLKLEWKISEKGNSGIIFYIHEDKKKYSETYLTGPEMQILDNGTPIKPGHPDGKLYTHRAGDLYDLLAAKELTHPQGEWNNVEIKCVNGKLDFYVNGEHALQTTLWDKYWDEMVANSKFKYMPDFGKFHKGKIALQNHGGEVWFRNIKIRRL